MGEASGVVQHHMKSPQELVGFYTESVVGDNGLWLSSPQFSASLDGGKGGEGECTRGSSHRVYLY